VAHAASLRAVEAAEGARPRVRPARADLDDDHDRAVACHDVELEHSDAEVLRDDRHAAFDEISDHGELGARAVAARAGHALLHRRPDATDRLERHADLIDLRAAPVANNRSRAAEFVPRY